jgi:hypothetical protein
MPDMSHLWQRFLLASALVFGLLIGVVATVFGYSNTASVDVSWSIFHIDGIPLWTVAVVPLTIVLAAGTVYHWLNGLHHFTEHMRHRRRVHELEAELATLRNHLDQVLEMPDQSTSRLPAKHITAEAPAEAEPAAIEPEPAPAVAAAAASAAATVPALPEPARSNGAKAHRRAARKRVALTAASEPKPADLTSTEAKTPGPAEASVTVPATEA